MSVQKVAGYIDSVLNENHVVSFRAFVNANKATMYEIKITDKLNDMDQSNVTLYVTPHDSKKTIRKALANKSLLHFEYV